jgi:NAD(P)-dependent dehydrogenase (short-subunit alcohol dehydrogenase family)
MHPLGTLWGKRRYVQSPRDVSGRRWLNGDRQGTVDILVNAAGIAHSSLLATTSRDLIDRVVQTNLLGTIWGCQTVAKAMMRQRRGTDDPGCIINVSSLLAVKGGRGSTAYAASKAGVLGKVLTPCRTSWS